MSIPPYLLPDGDGGGDDRPPAEPKREERSGQWKIAGALVAALLVGGVIGAVIDRQVRTSDDRHTVAAAVAAPSTVAPSTPTAGSADAVYSVQQPLTLGALQVVVRSYQEEHRTKAVSPVDSVWLVVNVEITNLGADAQTLAPSMFILGFLKRAGGYSLEGPTVGVRAGDHVVARKTKHLILGYPVPVGADAFRVLVRMPAGAATVNLNCC